MVPPRGRGSNSRSRTHGRDALSNGSSGCNSSGGGTRARARAIDKGRRRLSYSRLKVVSSVHLHHGWVVEGEDIERMEGGEVS